MDKKSALNEVNKVIYITNKKLNDINDILSTMDLDITSLNLSNIGITLNNKLYELNKLYNTVYDEDYFFNNSALYEIISGIYNHLVNESFLILDNTKIRAKDLENKVFYANNKLDKTKNAVCKLKILLIDIIMGFDSKVLSENDFLDKVRKLKKTSSRYKELDDLVYNIDIRDNKWIELFKYYMEIYTLDNNLRRDLLNRIYKEESSFIYKKSL